MASNQVEFSRSESEENDELTSFFSDTEYFEPVATVDDISQYEEEAEQDREEDEMLRSRFNEDIPVRLWYESFVSF